VLEPRVYANHRTYTVFLKLFLLLLSAVRTAATSVLLQIASAVLLVTGLTLAQDLPNAPLVQLETEPGLARPSAPGIAADKEGHERIFVVVPAFGITNRQDAPALTAKAKFALASRQAFDPFMWISTGIQAGMSQASNEFPQYGQGATGYGKRYGAAMLDVINGGFAGTAFCVLLKEDPRYFRLGSGSIEQRVLYSLAQQVSAKSDRGTRQFNWANVLGTFTSSALSNAYYPRPNRGFSLTVNRAVVSLLWGFTGELTDEFGPDVSRKLFHRGK
jgi:hypothetical protein